MDEKNIIITTTDLKDDYEILDSLCVTKQLKYNPKEAYFNQELNELKQRLRKQCIEIGGDAVICCHISFDPGHCDYALIISGTAVKLKSKQ